MTRSKNTPELNSSPDWCYFDVTSNDHDRFAPDHTFIVDVAHPIPGVARIVSMTKFDSSGAGERWLCVLKEELPEELTPVTWLKQTNTRLERRAAALADRTPEVKRILRTTINNATTEDKNAFIQLLFQEFSDN